MARAKKETALTPEERLQAALVPNWEWPYKLPENWCWVRLYSLAHIISKGTTPKGGKDAYVEKGIRFLRIENINEDGSISHENIKHITEEMHTGFLRRSILCKDDILISIAGTLGKTGIVGEADLPLNTNQAISFVRLIRGNLLPQYIKMSIDNPKTQDMLISQTKVTSIPNLTLEIIGNCAIPLAPLAEQQRIVDRIESLFAKLDEAKEKAQAVVDSFETRKAAILHKAFTGELTAKWRRTHGLSLDTWKEVAADSLFEYVTSGSRGWAKYYDESGAVFIRMGNLDHGTIELDFSDIQHVKLPNKAEGQRSRIRKNDILISITADVGMVGLVRNDDFEGYINQHIALARPVMSESAEFIAWYLVSDIGLKQMQEKQRGATKVGLNLNDIRALQLKIPLIEEQNEILKVIKMWIGKEQQSQEAAEAVLDQIELMKKSILARAFRGELGTNDPNEESAVELLKQII